MSVSGLVFGEQKSSIFAKAMKSILPKASAATAPPAPVAAAPVAPVDPDMDPDLPVMALRRNLVGKAFASHVQSSNRAPKYDDLNGEASGLFPKQISDGFNLEVQRALGQRFMTMHRVAIGQRNQEDPPSNYSLMTHLATESGALLVGLWSTHGNMMARLIKEARGTLLQAAHNAHVNAKGEESTSTEFEAAHATSNTSLGLKYAFQMTPQGGAGVWEGSYVRRIFGGLFAGIHALLIPNQGRCMTSFSARYENSFSNKKEEREWNENLERAMEQVGKLTEADPLSAYDACVLAAAFFKPKYVFALAASPAQMSLDLSYIRQLSSSITLGTQLSFSPPPPNPNNTQPTLRAKWQIGYEYNVEPDRTSAKVAMSNFESITCTFDDTVTDFLSISVNAHANWPKDSYKTGFGITLRL
jgi:hypothetical protein